MLLTNSSNISMKAKRCQVTYKEFFLIYKENEHSWRANSGFDI